ncbi:MAG: DEAD/DEAH box helicase family protein, partial [Chloroflexi bacterium]|nr:DEAD/DEAH box helicase family protein [Chloroflexota bacterium]
MEAGWRQLSAANRSADRADSLVNPAALGLGPEFGFPEPLYAFQSHGVKWLTERGHALLADDMGLGKTVQAIVALRLLVSAGEVGRALVVCPKSVVTSWRRHLCQWAPELTMATIEGPSHERRRKWPAFARRCQVLLASYETVVRDARAAIEIPFDLVVVDEAQRIKNIGSEASQAVRRLTAERRWALTGTPQPGYPPAAPEQGGQLLPWRSIWPSPQDCCFEASHSDIRTLQRLIGATSCASPGCLDSHCPDCRMHCRKHGGQ